ncbi:hypothetical protein PYCC9005_004827 [Savitreella phatthalungensis]
MASVNCPLKVYYTIGELRFVARGGQVKVTRLPSSRELASVDLRPCVCAVVNASPELVNNKASDFSVYTADATEVHDGELYEGQGLLSWNLAQPTRGPRIVSGHLKPGLSGMVFEVRMKLTRVDNASQTDFALNMALFERVARQLPASFDFTKWAEVCRSTHALLLTRGTTDNTVPTAITTLHKVRELVDKGAQQVDSPPQMKTFAPPPAGDIPRGMKRKLAATDSARSFAPIASVAGAQAAAMRKGLKMVDAGGARYCGNCRAPQARGKWRMVSVAGIQTALCAACSGYFKHNGKMRPEALWKIPTLAIAAKRQELDRSITPPIRPNTAMSLSEAVIAAQTSPVRQVDTSATPRTTMRQAQSSPPGPSTGRHVCTPERVLTEISANTPVAIADLCIEDLVGFLQTPKKVLEDKRGVSSSPWRSMFTTINEDSPSRLKLDKYLAELGMTATGSSLTGSPGGRFDGQRFEFENGSIGNELFGSPSKLDLSLFMPSSPPGMGLFTSDSVNDENMTPQGEPPASEDNLFTPRKTGPGGVCPISRIIP